jgi:hypothetical protein
MLTFFNDLRDNIKLVMVASRLAKFGLVMDHLFDAQSFVRNIFICIQMADVTAV